MYWKNSKSPAVNCKGEGGGGGMIKSKGDEILPKLVI